MRRSTDSDENDAVGIGKVGHGQESVMCGWLRCSSGPRGSACRSIGDQGCADRRPTAKRASEGERGKAKEHSKGRTSEATKSKWYKK